VVFTTGGGGAIVSGFRASTGAPSSLTSVVPQATSARLSAALMNTRIMTIPLLLK
jgi:hypothetical protein